MPRRTTERWAARRQAPIKLWLVGLLALFFAAATLLHTGEGHTAFGDGGHSAAASIGVVPCDSDGVDHANDQHCVTVSCHFCVPVTALLALQLPKAAPIAVTMTSDHTDRRLMPQFRPPKFSAQT